MSSYLCLCNPKAPNISKTEPNTLWLNITKGRLLYYILTWRLVSLLKV